MKENITANITEYIISTIIFLLIIGAIKLIVSLIKILKKTLSTLFSIPTKGFQYKNTGWNDIDRLVLHTKAMVQVPRSQYQPDPMYYNAFMNNPYNPINIQNMVINIMEHAGYQGPIPEVVYFQYGNRPSNHSINGKSKPAQIQIIENPDIPPSDLLALLIHECMHVYDAYYRIEYGDGFNQENAVDVLAVYLGFYQILSKSNKFYTNQKDLNYAFKRIHN